MTTYKFLIIEDDDSDFSRLKQLLDDYASCHQNGHRFLPLS